MSSIRAIQHVALPIPKGAEAEARRFYCDDLGFSEIEKPERLVKRGGAWLTQRAVTLHLSVDSEFVAPRKFHIALLAEDLDGLESHLSSLGLRCTRAKPLAKFRRVYAYDPFGNRVELMQEP